jgi:hypothetical protein
MDILTLIRRVASGASPQEVLDEITRSGDVPGLPMPMGIVRKKRTYKRKDDNDK